MHKCALDVKRALYNMSRKYTNAYVVKMDVAKFFDNIDRNILFNIIKRKVSDKDFLYFTKKLLDSSNKYDKKRKYIYSNWQFFITNVWKYIFK